VSGAVRPKHVSAKVVLLLECWIPAGDLDELNLNIIGRIDVVAEYR
jgi:hypothetical protein